MPDPFQPLVVRMKTRSASCQTLSGRDLPRSSASLTIFLEHPPFYISLSINVDCIGFLLAVTGNQPKDIDYTGYMASPPVQVSLIA